MSVYSAFPGLFYPGTTWPGFVDPALVDVPTPRPRTFAARLVAYEADGDRIGPMPEHLSFDAVVRYNDVGTLSLSYSAHAAQGTVVTRPLIQGTEIALEVWTGSEWWEPAGARYIVTEREFDTQDDGQAVVNLSAQSMGWMLAKVRSLNTTVLLPEDHSQAGKRPFYTATPGAVVDTILNEYEAREGSRAWARDFDESVDSMSVPWAQTKTFFFEHLQSLDVMVESLAAAGLCDWTTIGRDLALYNPDTALGVDSSSVIVLHEGSHVVSAPSRESIADLISRIGFEGGQAEDAEGNRQPPLRLLEDDEAAPAPWGAWEGAYSNSSITDEGTALSYLQAELARSGRVRGQYTRELTEALPEGSYLPLYDYGPGHWVTAPGAEGLEKLRVQEVQVRDDGARTTVALVLNDVFLDADLRRAKRALGLPAGSASGGSTVRPVPEGQDKRQPAAPAFLSVSTSTYLDSDGAARGIIHAEWGEVTTATAGDGGGPLEVSAYEVWHRPNVLGAPWTRATATAHPDTDADLSPYDVGSEWQVKVRARGRYATTPGDWSETKTIVVADDTVPPPVPSAPTWTDHLGIPIPVWDGLDKDGNPMPRDFAKIQCHVSTSASTPGDLADSQVHDVRRSAGQFAPVTDYAAETTVYARFRAFDRSGNASDWTSAVSATVADILAPIQDDIDDLVNNVVPGLEGAITTASGRFTASTDAPQPSDGVGKPVGAFWSQYDGQRLVGTWVWDGDSWEEREPQLVHIDTGTFGDLDGARLKAYSVLAQAIAVGDFSNPVDNPMTYPDLEGWVAEAGKEDALTYHPEASHPAGGTHSLRFAAYGAVNEYGLVGLLAKNTREFKVHEGETYRVTFRRRQSGGGTSVTVGLRVQKTDGGYQNVTVTSTTSAASLAQHTGEVTIPADGIMARPFVSVFRTSGSTDVTDIEIRNMVGGVLITDGAVSAPKIAAGAVTAAKLEAVLALVTRVVSGDPNGARAEHNPDGFEVWRVHPESGPYRLTGLTADGPQTLGIMGANEAVLGGIDEDGFLTATGATIGGDPQILGRPLLGSFAHGVPDPESWLWELPWGRVAVGTLAANNVGTNSTEGVTEITFEAIPGRTYRVTVHDFPINVVTPGSSPRVIPHFRWSYGTPTTLAAAPTLASGVRGWAHKHPNGAGYISGGITNQVACHPNGTTNDHFWIPAGWHRVLYCINTVNCAAWYDSADGLHGVFVVEDTGPIVPSSAKANFAGRPDYTPPAQGRVKHRSFWVANQSRSYQGSIISNVTSGRVGQGKVASMTAGPRHGVVGFTGNSIAGSTEPGVSITTALNGATDITARLRVYCARSVLSAVPALIGRSNTLSTTSPTVLFTVSNIPRGGSKEFGLPGWGSWFQASSSNRYITFGPGSNVNNTNYAEFYADGGSSNQRMVLEIEYAKG